MITRAEKRNMTLWNVFNRSVESKEEKGKKNTSEKKFKIQKGKKVKGQTHEGKIRGFQEQQQ